LKAISGKQKGVREKVDATFAGIAVKPMRQSHEATIGLRSCNGVAFVLRFRDSQQSLGYKKRFFTLNCGEQKANMLDSFCGRRTQARAGDCGGNPGGTAPENYGRSLRLPVESADRIARGCCGSVGGADHAED